MGSTRRGIKLLSRSSFPTADAGTGGRFWCSVLAITQVEEIVYEACHEAGVAKDQASSIVDKWLAVKVTHNDK